ncbi:MAG TPA: tetratricopeptide repeat protein [Candidatus Polarisedimenticolia bacterium]|nr:tetratricopeptide repeat protein [Candidatus Polarisedimenticolia bacterium]
MKLAHLRSNAIRTRLFVFCAAFFFFAGAHQAVPLLGNQSSNNAQSSSKPAVQSRTQKVANPLNDLLEEAQRDIDKNNFESAIAPLQKVIADQPEFAYAHFQLAYVYTALKRTDEARAEYTRTIAIDSKMSEAYLNLGMLLLDKKENAAAVTPLRKAVDLLPAQSHPRYLLAVALDRSGDHAGAAEAFEALHHLDPNNVTAINYLGWAALRNGRPAAAEARFRRAVEIQPKEPEGHKGLAESLDAQKKSEAAATYRDYLELMPNDAEARARLVHLLLDQSQSDAALAELDRLDAGKQPTIESLKLRADVQIAGKKWDDSIVTLQQALALAPNDAQLHGGLGRIFLQKRDFAAAEKELRIALRLDSKNLGYWKDLSTTFFLGGNYPAALATLDEIAKMEQPGAGVWFIRAICYDKLNQPKLALEAYQKFLALDQDKNPDQVWQARERSKVLQRMLDRKR